MTTRLTRQQLHALVWDQPITKLAKQFGLSDVALHKICRKLDAPTPPTGHWAKKAHGKPVTTTPLPHMENACEIVIRESTASNEPAAIAEARSAVAAAIAAAPAGEQAAPNPIVERTVTKLAAAKPKADGLIHCHGRGVATVAVRPESAQRAATLLQHLVQIGESVGVKLVSDDTGAAWQCDGETITFELVEVADQVEHVATQRNSLPSPNGSANARKRTGVTAIGGTGASPRSQNGSSAFKGGLQSSWRKCGSEASVRHGASESCARSRIPGPGTSARRSHGS